MNDPVRFDFYRQRDLGETINGTFSFLHQEFIPLGKAILFITGPFIFTAMLLTVGLSFEDTNPSQAATLLNAGLIFLPLLAAIVSAIAVVNHYVRLYILDDQTRFSIRGMVSCVISDIWRLIGLGILLFLCIFAGAILIIIPGFYLSIALTLAVPVSLQERATAGQSIKRSMQLVKDYWWFTFVLMFLMYIIVFALQLLFQIPMYVFSFFTLFHGADPRSIAPMLRVFQSLGYLGYFISGLPSLAVVVHYYSQREKKEAAGLRKKIDALNATVAQ